MFNSRILERLHLSKKHERVQDLATYFRLLWFTSKNLLISHDINTSSNNLFLHTSLIVNYPSLSSDINAIHNSDSDSINLQSINFLSLEKLMLLTAEWW